MKAILSGKEFTEEVLVEAWMEEYDRGKQIKGYGRNGHGSMAWFYEGEKTLEEIRDFQRNRVNPGNAPAMRAVPIGLLADDNINIYAAVNANATHPNINAVLSSQCIARAAEYMLVKRGEPHYIIDYCFEKIAFHSEYTEYLKNVNKINGQRELGKAEHAILCGPQPIVEPYFLSGIHGLPSDSKYTAGCVLFILKYSKDAMDALRKSIYMGGDVDSVASIATGIMAGKTGLGSLPPFMLENIEDKAYLEQIAGEFDQKITALGRLKN
jgi:ADP-ribosylglycohydrolase